MAKIVVCDHRSRVDVDNLVKVLEKRGHEVVHLNDEDVRVVVDAIERFNPDVVYSDLVFEKKDELENLNQYWGVRIYAEFRTRKAVSQVPFLIESKFIGPEQERVLTGAYGIPGRRLSKTYMKPLKKVAEWIESFLGSSSLSRSTSSI